VAGYSVREVILQWNASGVINVGRAGFPATFRYLLFSGWICLGNDGANRAVDFNNSVVFGNFSLNNSQVHVHLLPGQSQPTMFDGSFAYAAGGYFTHLLISIDGVGGIIQIYANDAPLALTSGGWTGSPAGFNLGGFTQWQFGASGSHAPGTGVGDIFLAAPTSFFDLSVVANRRQFINADLSPVDLGATGSTPLGTQPPIYLTVRPGDTNPSNFASNNGTGGSFNIYGTLVFLPDGSCNSPSPPPPPPPAPGSAIMAMDDMSLITIPTPGCRVFLQWSNDRGHVWGSPVGQDMGPRGYYLDSVQWQRLGYARDRVFQIFWSCPAKTVLQGAWIEADTSPKT